MPEPIAQAITGIRNSLELARLELDRLNERETTLYMVDPILRAAGWDLSNPVEVRPEYRVDRYKADYALNLDGQGGASAFIEIKKPNVNLNDHHPQLLNYCAQQNVDLGILTNGNPAPIGNSGIFAATAPMSSNEVKKHCQNVLREFGYSEDCFKINLE